MKKCIYEVYLFMNKFVCFFSCKHTCIPVHFWERHFSEQCHRQHTPCTLSIVTELNTTQTHCIKVSLNIFQCNFHGRRFKIKQKHSFNWIPLESFHCSLIRILLFEIQRNKQTQHYIHVVLCMTAKKCLPIPLLVTTFQLNACAHRQAHKNNQQACHKPLVCHMNVFNANEIRANATFETHSYMLTHIHETVNWAHILYSDRNCVYLCVFLLVWRKITMSVFHLTFCTDFSC